MAGKLTPGSKEYLEALAKSQGEIKEDKSTWSKLITFERNNPKAASALKLTPIMRTIMEGVKNGTNVKSPSGQFNTNSPFIKSLLGDALLAINAGAASKSGLIPTLMTETGSAVGAGGSNYLGQVLDEKLGTSWLTPALTFVGGVVGGAKGYKDAQRMLFTEELPKKAIQKGLVSKEFVVDAVTDALHSKISKQPPMSYSGKNADKIWMKRLMDVYNRDRYIETHLVHDVDEDILVHGDPAATGVTKTAAGIGIHSGNFAKKYPGFKNGKLSSGKGNIYSNTSRSYTAEEHPIFWGNGTPFYEAIGKRFDDMLTWSKDPEFKHYMSTNDRTKHFEDPSAFSSEIPYRFLETKAISAHSPELRHIGPTRNMQEVTTGSIPEELIVGHEYSPLTHTFSRVLYKSK